MNPKTHPTYCHYPFKALVFKQWSKDGTTPVNVTPCCMMMNPVSQDPLPIWVGRSKELVRPTLPNKHYNMGFTNEELIEKNPLEIFNSPQYEKLRSDLLNGIKNESCTVCWKMEERGLKSFRQNSTLEGRTSYHPYLQGGSEGLFEFDITLSNLCNLACRMCNMGSSHQLGKDVEAMRNNGTYEEFQKVSDRAMPDIKGMKSVIYDKDNNEVIDWLMNNTHQITMLKASGGEPFYDRRVVKVLEKYVEDDNAKNITLKFHTNATQFTPELAKLLNNFKEQGHTFSIDGTQKTYNYIRHNSDWNKLNDSIDCFFIMCKNISHQYFNMVLSSLNILNVADYIEWICNKCAYHKVPDWYIHFSEMFPENRGTSIRNIPVELLEESLDRIVEVLDSGISNAGQFHSGVPSNTVQATIRGKEYKEWYRFDLQNLVGQIQNAIDNHNGDIKKMETEITILDKVRDQSYKDYLDPLLINILNGEAVQVASSTDCKSAV